MDRDAARTHDHYFPPLTPDAVEEDAQVQRDLRPPRPRRHTIITAAKNVAILLTAVTLALGLLGGAVRGIAVGTRRVDQMEYLIGWSRHADSLLTSIDHRLSRVEARRP